MKTDMIPQVSIRCTTYNHAPYIRDAIEGFLMQKTNFPFEIIIHDDASTDGTAEIVKEYTDKYPDLIIPILQKENQYSKGRCRMFAFINKEISGKFVALCEGDDYWTDPLKLQKQFDFMEKYKDCSMCFHRSKIKIHDKKKNNKEFKHLGEFTKEFKHKFFSEDKLFYEGGSNVPTASIFTKRKYLEELPDWYYKCPVGDMPLKLFLSQKGRIGFLNEVMAVRRIGTPGSWNQRVGNNVKEKGKYLIGMIDMLVDFNKYSKNKYSKEVFKKIVFYDVVRLNLGNKKSYVSNKIKDFKALGLRQKFLLTLLDRFPYVFRLGYISNKIVYLLTL
jgi:glycosyltransferase involved in cell wall biosynthesis